MAFPPGGRTKPSSALRTSGPKGGKPPAKAAGNDRSPSRRNVRVRAGTGQCESRTKRYRARGLTIVESAISIIVVGGMLVAALNTISASAMGRSMMNDRARGQLLAMHLMSEILQRNYEEPVDPVSFGRESSESGGSRALYDDVDDYHGWSTTPPESMNGTAMPDLAGWQRSVVVEFVDPNDLTSVQVVDLGVKRITVTVKKDNAEAATMVAIRTNGLKPALGHQMDTISIE